MVAVGYASLTAVTTGKRNTALGYQSGDSITDGEDNVIIGWDADGSGTGATNQIVIGRSVTGTGDNQTVIGNSSQTHVIFGGDALISGSAGSTGSFGRVDSHHTLTKPEGLFIASTISQSHATINSTSGSHRIYDSGDDLVIEGVNLGSKGAIQFKTGNGPGHTSNATHMVVSPNGNVGIDASDAGDGLSTDIANHGGGLTVYDGSTSIIKLVNAASGVGASDGMDLMYGSTGAVINNREATKLRLITNSNTFTFTTDNQWSGSATSTGSFGKLLGDGSELTGLTSAAIETYNNSGDNRILTSVNSTTVQGEAGLTFDGTELRVQGDIVAENYIVSSSVTYMTQSFSSGSTIFGDSVDDTHKFTGSLQITGGLQVDNGNISGSATSTGSFGAYGNNFIPVGDNALDLGSSGNEWKDLYVDGTAYLDRIEFPHEGTVSFGGDGIISAAGNTFQIYLERNASGGQVGIFTNTPTSTLDVNGSFAASGNISGSATSTGSFGKLEVGSQIRLIEGGDSFINGGDFGIGTSTPVARLEIEDDGTSNSMLLKLTVDDTNVYGMVFGNDTFSTTDTDGGQHILSNDGTYIIRTIGAGAASRFGAGIAYNNYNYLEITGSIAEFTTTTISGSATSTGSFGQVITTTPGRIIGNITEIIEVTVVDDGGNHFAFEGATTPNLVVSEGKTYRFDQSDSTNDTHPFAFSLTEDGSTYSTGVTTVGTPGVTGAYTEIKVTKATANRLFYKCTAHSGMGNQGNILKNDLGNFGGNISGSSTSTGSFGSIIAGSDVGGFQQNQFFSPIRMKTDGTANAPAIVINSGGNGIYKYANNEIGISANGAATAVIRQAGLELLGGAYVSGSAQSTGSFGDGRFASKVGIGLGITTALSTPHSYLDVRGDNVTPSNGNGSYHTMQLIDTSTSAEGVGGGIGFGGKFVGNSDTLFGEIRGLKENGTSNNYAGALTFQTRAHGANLIEQVRIDSSGNLEAVRGNISGSLTSTGSFGHIMVGGNNFTTAVSSSAAASGFGTGGGSGISNVVEDTTPQLGGNLDTNGNDIVLSDTTIIYYSGSLGTYNTDNIVAAGWDSGYANTAKINLKRYGSTQVGLGFQPSDQSNDVTALVVGGESLYEVGIGAFDGSRIPQYNLHISASNTDYLIYAEGSQGGNKGIYVRGGHTGNALLDTFHFAVGNTGTSLLRGDGQKVVFHSPATFFSGSGEIQMTGSLVGTSAQFTDYVGNVSGSVTSTGSFGRLETAGVSNIGGILSIPGFPNVSSSLAAAVAGGDNLGNHTATTDLNLDSNSITNVSSLTATGNISSSLSSTGSFGHIMKGGVNFDTAVSSSAATAGFGGGGSSDSFSDGTATLISGSATSTGSFGVLELAAEGRGVISFTHGELSNTVIGYAGTGQSLASSGGRQNTLIGYTVGSQITTGDQNVAIGQENLSGGNSTGNTAVGYRALKGMISGIGNVGIGRLAADAVQSGNYNIAIGQGVGLTGTGATNQIGIGYDVVVPGDNQTVIGAAAQTHVIFGGDALISGSAQSTGSFGHIMKGGVNFDTAVSSSAAASGFGTGGGGSGISNIVEDSSPQLGGDLDLNSNDVTGTGNINIVGNISGSLTSTGSFGVYSNDFIPSIDNTHDLGSSTHRWANAHIGDIELSNEGTEGNEVDGTTGSWTIQEGEDDLYLLNRKSGKKYKFKLEEI